MEDEVQNLGEVVIVEHSVTVVFARVCERFGDSEPHSGVLILDARCDVL
jgi:hypothetical protein